MSTALDTNLARAAAGDGEAFRALIAPELVGLRALCRRLAPTEADTQDLLQETPLAAFLACGGCARASASAAGFADSPCSRPCGCAGAPRGRRCRWWRPTRRRRARISICASACAKRRRRCRLASGRVVVGRWVVGYGSRELAATLGVPGSTIRGRLFQARRRLRLALGEFASASKESSMSSGEDVELVFEDLRFGRCMGEPPTPLHRFAAVHAAGGREDVCLLVPVTDEDAAAIEGAGGELLGELLRFGGVELDQATLERLAAGAWSGALCLRRGDEQRRLAARPGEAIAAAFGLQRPLRIRHAAWLAESVDPRDHAAQRARHLAARRWLEARVAARPRQAAASRVVVTVALEPAPARGDRHRAGHRPHGPGSRHCPTHARRGGARRLAWRGRARAR
jgi:hypothetical protein